jgi:3-keto-5-aminohexanoate cleavage enzyme
MQRRGIQPELEAFDTGHVHYIRTLEAKGLLRPPCWVNLFLGNLGTAPASLGVFLAMIQNLPPGVIWAGAGIGDYQYWVNQWAVALGGQVRVGMEDSLWMDANKMEPSTNPKQAMRIAAFARSRGREPVSIDRAREILGMEQG